jgi:hypothetical protein
LCLFGAGVGNAAAGTHTAQALEHAQAAAKESLLEDIPEHAPHVQAAEQAKEAGSEHPTAAKTALYEALRAKDTGSSKKAVESAESRLEMNQVNQARNSRQLRAGRAGRRLIRLLTGVHLLIGAASPQHPRDSGNGNL